MKNYFALRSVPHSSKLKSGDYLVLFGELFARGYGNGLVEAAEKRGLKVIRATVGRRGPDNELRALNSDEIPDQTTSPVINIPLEAGFDMEKIDGGPSLVDLMKDVKLTDWSSFKVPQETLDKAHKQGTERFRKNLKAFVEQLEKKIPAGSNVLFAHLMAGGVPRARIIMPLMNKVFKGTGDRHMASREFWASGLGKVAEKNFLAVTAETFDLLIQETSQFREKRENAGQFVSYSAYGYHGTEVLMNGKFQWQSYAPYLQGWAKMKLEDYSRAWSAKGVKACVYNCPEILTNSSSIFQGVEIPLYPLLLALDDSEMTAKCQALLKDDQSVEKVLETCQKTLNHPAVQAQSKFDSWPDHNTAEQMQILLTASQQIFDQHKDPKNLMTAVLSEVVFQACGEIMLNDLPGPQSPVAWINHDVVAKHYLKA